MTDMGAREKATVETMIGMYCRGNHGTSGVLCDGCAELRDYAFSRIDGCPLGEGKLRCDKCQVHCYRPDMRERIRTVMRYSGPRMVLHPVMALRHFLRRRGFWKRPPRRPSASSDGPPDAANYVLSPSCRPWRRPGTPLRGQWPQRPR